MIIDQRMSRKNILLEKADKSASPSTAASLNHDENVKTWTDFVRVPYHPKSVASFSNIVHEDVVTKYLDGYLFAQTESFRDELESKFRFSVEDCDRLQGFNVISDVHDAFSGISGSVLQYVRDECSKSAIVCYPVLPPQVMLQSKNDSVEEQNMKIQDKWRHSNHISNLTMSLCYFLDESDLVLPLTLLETLDKNCSVCFREFRRINYKTSSLYHTSAILASAVESSAVPWRVMNKSLTLSDLVAYMTEFQRKIATCQIDFLMDNDFSIHFVPLLPEFCKLHSDRFARSIVSLQGANIFCRTPYDRDQTEEVGRKLESIFLDKRNLCYLTSDSQTLKPYYPSIFEGIGFSQRTSDSVKSITDPNIYLPVITEIETSRKVENFIDLLISSSNSSEIKRLKLNNDMSDYVAEILQSTKKCYETA
uniref:DML1/Misato tubulin domain-containing protein n=1 Tax=Romanomermis culicivorax TaxID=13658 RepID=A0A915L0K8_ROMCU